MLPMPLTKPLASLSLDLDNQWSYLKIHGDAGWEGFPSYLDIVTPRVLDFLRERKLGISVFVVGQDAALAKNRDALAAIVAAGHEIGNHSFLHEPWLHLYSEEQLERELERAEIAIEQATGRRPIGFRGPGFSVSPATLRVLIRRGYRYDASTLPTFLGPLARAYYLMTTNLSEEERRQRQALFGSFRDGLLPLKPYRWRLAEGEILEMPVTTMPLSKTPIHVSYLLYLSLLSPALALRYFRAALWLCRRTGVQPSLLLHPLDFLSQEDAPALSFFPAMRLPKEKKLAIVSAALRLLSEYFTVVPMRQHVQVVAAEERLPLLDPHLHYAHG
jgi:hypothetical protein